MRRIVCMLGVVILGGSLSVARVAAQENDALQIGVFADYFRPTQTNTNSAGVGARVAFPFVHRVKLEAEMAYDFGQAFTEGFTNSGTGTVTFQRTNQRVLHGLFGPKIELGHGAVHPFVFVKGGFVNFNMSPAPATVGTFVSSVQNLRSQNVNAALYPGAGIQGRLGPVGLRLDLGDEMYFNGGTHHNVKVTFGPFIRF